MKTDTGSKIVEYIAKNGRARVIDLVSMLGISLVAIHKQLIKLITEGKINKTGKAPKVFYVINKSQNLQQGAISWAYCLRPVVVNDEFYCPTRDIFQARLGTITSNLEQELGQNAYLLGAVAGEIGNNSFDHNLGRWRDIPGIFFAHDYKNKTIILADRGVGILKTIKYVVPGVKNDLEALEIAFTKIISGRKEERRGNGLKFVAEVVKKEKWKLIFFSGKGEAVLNSNLTIKKVQKKLDGCLSVLQY